MDDLLDIRDPRVSRLGDALDAAERAGDSQRIDDAAAAFHVAAMLYVERRAENFKLLVPSIFSQTKWDHHRDLENTAHETKRDVALDYRLGLASEREHTTSLAMAILATKRRRLFDRWMNDRDAWQRERERRSLEDFDSKIQFDTARKAVGRVTRRRMRRGFVKVGSSKYRKSVDEQ